MSLILSQCIEYHENRKVCTASELGKTYTLNNVSKYKVKKVKVDKCIISKETSKKCDYLMHLTGNERDRAIFIELKGGALIDAVKQLHESISYFKGEFSNCEISARIVGTTDVPNFKNSPHYRKLTRVIEQTKGTIKRATNRIMVEDF